MRSADCPCMRFVAPSLHAYCCPLRRPSAWFTGALIISFPGKKLLVLILSEHLCAPSAHAVLSPPWAAAHDPSVATNNPSPPCERLPHSRCPARAVPCPLVIHPSNLEQHCMHPCLHLVCRTPAVNTEPQEAVRAGSLKRAEGVKSVSSAPFQRLILTPAGARRLYSLCGSGSSMLSRVSSL